MKGVSEWIFIIISVMLGIFTITFGSVLLLRQADITQKQLSITQFSSLDDEMNRMCLKGGVGQTTFIPVSIQQNARAIYVANASDEPPPDKVSVYITAGQSHVGTFLCLQFFDENIPRCGHVNCDMIFTYIGSPSLQSTLQTIIAQLTGGPPVYKFYLLLNKTDYNLVQITAFPIIGDKLPNVAVTGTTTSSMTTQTTTTTTTTASTLPSFQAFAKDNANNPMLLGHTEPSILKVGSTFYLYYRTDHSIGVATSNDGINWNDMGTILTYSPGQWDSDYVISPSVTYWNGNYYLFYEGNNGQESSIGVAISSNPSSGFVKYSGNPILTKGTGFESVLVGTPTVVEYVNQFYMFYHGYDGTSDRVAVAVSSDLAHWQKSANNPVIDLGSQNSWDSVKTGRTSVLISNNIFYTFYEGFDGTNWRIGLATQADPMQKFIKSNANPVLNLGSPGSWDNYYIQLPAIVNINGVYWLYYSGNDGQAFHLGRAKAI